jgi:hypothetical protein|tara:strand:+ start:3771 stop:4862 length:1092 start_codon:yes stop_codon:yes gene_type:complete
MADVDPLSLGGSVQGDAFTGTFATDNSLWLKVFGGEVLAAFEMAIEVTPRIQSRTISSGKSATFPVHGRAHARSHVPGEDILDAGNTSTDYVDAGASGLPQTWASGTSTKYLSFLGSNEKVININDMQIASVFIDDLDEAKAHYDLREIYTKELGRSLARRVDNLSCRAIAAAAAGTAGAGMPMRGGQSVTDANIATQSDVLVSGIITAVQKLDEYDIPAEERMIILDPARYYLLLRAAGGAVGTGQSYAALLSQDYSLGNGDFAEGRVLMVAGCPVVTSNNTGFGVDWSQAAGGLYNTDLNIDMSNYVGLVAHKSAAGMVKLRDITMESDYMVSHQGHLFVSKLACGVGALRTDAAVSLATP